MTQTMRHVIPLAVLVAAMLALNLVGQRLNALFLELPGIDKVLHFAFHAVLFVCLRRAAAVVVADRRWQLRLAIAGALLIAIADELVQGLTPSRSVEGADLLADVCGLAFAWVLTVRPAPVVRVAVGCSALALAAYVTYDTHVRLIEYTRGLRLERKHDFAGAHQHYLRALDNGLRTANLYNAIAWAQVESGGGDPRDAVRYAELALAEQPENADILDTYGWALHHAGRAGEAIPYLQRAFRAKPDMYCIHFHLGAAYLAVGDRERAAFHFQRQVERHGTREAQLARQALKTMEARQ